MKLEESFIYFLLNKKHYLTASEVAKEFNLSTKTIYRMIKKINSKSSNGELVITEKGKGIKLNYNVYLRTMNDSTTRSFDIYSPTERRINITQELLFKSPNEVERKSLFENYYISPSVIRADEEKISENLKTKGLILKKNGSKISIQGTEQSIRKALIDSLLKSNILFPKDLKTQSPNFNNENFDFALRQIEIIEHTFGIIIPYPYNINLLTHIYILIKRVGHGIFDSSENEYLNGQPIIKEQSIHYKIALNIKENIENYTGILLPSSETMNILIYLTSSRIDKANEKILEFSAEVIEITNFFIEEFRQESNFNITSSLIFESLASHIKPMINRLKNNITIKNILTEDIKLEYSHLFNKISKISKNVSKKWGFTLISEDEIGFITLYFAKEIEEKFQKVRALLVCTTGMGTSEFLKVRLLKSFPDIKVQGTSSCKKCHQEFIDKNSVNLVISTVKIEAKLNIPIILVNSLFIQKDQENVRNAIKEIIWKRQTTATQNL